MLFLNATDLDRSREYGQESIIYSLEGSSQFRINARSGEHPPRPVVPITFTSGRLPTPSPGPAPGPSSLSLSQEALVWSMPALSAWSYP